MHLTSKDIAPVLQKINQWAASQSNIVGVALVGSYARNEARPDSDIDLVIITNNPDEYLNDDKWLPIFGEVVTSRKENYGAVTSLHVQYKNTCEIEFGITTSEWANVSPVDPGTREVVTHGMKILYDPAMILVGLQQAVART